MALALMGLKRFLYATFFILSYSYAQDLKPFEFDGCTYFPDAIAGTKISWKSCCFYHDLSYWRGGDLKARDKADLALRKCFQEKSTAGLGHLVYFAVWLGHFSPIKSKYQWGWGREEKRMLTPLNSAERRAVKIKLSKFCEKQAPLCRKYPLP